MENILEGGQKTYYAINYDTQYQYYDATYYDTADNNKIYRQYNPIDDDGYGNVTIGVLETIFTGFYYVNGQYSTTPPSPVVNNDGLPNTSGTSSKTDKAKVTSNNIVNTTTAQTKNSSNIIYYLIGGLMIAVFVIAGYAKGYFKRNDK